MNDKSPPRIDELRRFEAAHPGFTDCDVLWTNLSGTLRGKRLRWHEVESVFTGGRPRTSSAKSAMSVDFSGPAAMRTNTGSPSPAR
jgi:hypothetical protein